MKNNSMKFYTLFLLSLISLFSFADTTEVITYPGGAIQIEAKIYIKEDKKVYHGKYKEFYASGILYKEMHYKHGILHGKVKEYYSNANIKWQGKYKTGTKTGCWTFFSENGTKKMEGIFDKNGKMTSLTKFYINGKKSKREFYENSKLIKIIEWDIAGNVQKNIISKD